MMPLLATEFLGPEAAQMTVYFIVGLSFVIFALNQALSFYKTHMREHPTPSGTYLTIPNWKEAEAERKEDRKAILAGLAKIEKDLVESNRYQAAARQKIHGRLNRHENALYFLAGREESGGDSHAARVIRERLESNGGGADE
jgi:hypothetical protein